MAVGAQFAGNPALLQPALRQPGVGGPDCPRNVILGPRKVLGRADQRAQWRHDVVFDCGSRFSSSSTNCRAISSVNACSALATAPFGGSCGAQAYPVGMMIRRFAPFATATLTGVLLEIAPSAR